jgi:DNA mismatch repair protein MutS
VYTYNKKTMTQETHALTPLMQQYHDIKAEYHDVLLFFQVGDFYELFYDDAKKAAAFLGIALTSRGKHKDEPIPLCGVPVHTRDHYMIKLVKGGFKVAICEQIEKPRPGCVVRRSVTQVLTPGTLTDTVLLDEKSASYLFSFFPMADRWGVLFGELLTGQLFGTVLPANSEKILESELARFFPDEIVIPNTPQTTTLQHYLKKLGYFTTVITEDIVSDQVEADTWINTQFRNATAHVHKEESLRLALHYFYAYVKRNQKSALDQFRSLHIYEPDDFLILDLATQRNLELVKNNHDGGAKNTLFSVIDGAITSMGSRMIKKWLLRPLIKQEAIVQRQEVIATMVRELSLVQQLEAQLARVGDIERIVGRIALGRAQIHDYLSLVDALRVVPHIMQLVYEQRALVLMSVIAQHIGDFSPLLSFLQVALNDDTSKDWIIKQGFDAQLDYLRELVGNSNQKIIELERTEQEKTGISSLKIRYNQVHGYYIEVTKPNMHLVPDYYIRHQTLVGKERFLTPELQQLQNEIVGARDKIEQIEQEVFARVKADVHQYITPLRKLAHALAHLDALYGLSKVAYNNGYVRPVFNDSREIRITEGRHPVIESNAALRFVPNDTILTDEESMWIITGPNMGGKSTYLRQVAQICILAQIGSFVPARHANVPLLDRVFTRIGSGDNLAEGKSTFLIEMEETASICTQATKNSLVILDEVGRGTSTFDGLAIAQAVVEYLYETIQARCLFATHYHELTHLQERYPGIVSYYAASKKAGDAIIFLYTMVRGVADGSFGVQVARLAQLPMTIVSRAQELVEQFDKGGSMPLPTVSYDTIPVADSRVDQLTQENSLLRAQVQKLQQVNTELQLLDYDDISPKKALDILWKMKELM